MTVTQATLVMDNSATPAGTATFGPLNVTVSNNLLRVRAIGSLFQTAITVSLPSNGSNNQLWGIQYGPAGYTPKVLPTDVDDPAWLIVEHRDDAPVSSVWAPSTATAAYLYSTGLKLEWNGQLGLYASVDIYFTYGPAVGAGTVLYVNGALQAWEE